VIRKLFSALILFGALTIPALAQSLSILEGNYQFMVTSPRTTTGVDSTGDTFVTSVVPQVSYGWLNFNGAGTVTFTAFTQINSGGGGGGPVVGTPYTYTMITSGQGFEASFEVPNGDGTNATVTLFLGGVDNVYQQAASALILVTGTGSNGPLTGMAIRRYLPNPAQ
jgi:hypothetical protein